MKKTWFLAAICAAFPVLAHAQDAMPACMGGDAEACLQGTRDAQAVDDKPLMMRFIRQGCALDNVISCSDLGLSYLVGWEGEVDYAKARPLIEQGCADGYYRACANLGYMYYSGLGYPKDDAKAVTYYTQGCEGGSAAACSNVGRMYFHGEGVPKDMVKSDSYFAQACELGDYLSC